MTDSVQSVGFLRTIVGLFFPVWKWTLEVDSASFTDIKDRAGGDEVKIKQIMLDMLQI